MRNKGRLDEGSIEVKLKDYCLGIAQENERNIARVQLLTMALEELLNGIELEHKEYRPFIVKARDALAEWVRYNEYGK